MDINVTYTGHRIEKVRMPENEHDVMQVALLKINDEIYCKNCNMSMTLLTIPCKEVEDEAKLLESQNDVYMMLRDFDKEVPAHTQRQEKSKSWISRLAKKGEKNMKDIGFKQWLGFFLGIVGGIIILAIFHVASPIDVPSKDLISNITFILIFGLLGMIIGCQD
jgi:hypothetical protein